MDVRPMLCMPISNEEVFGLVLDEDYAFSPKLDGKRALIEADAGNLRAHGRDGQPINLPAELEQELYRLPNEGRFVLDGEYMHSGRLFLFDLIEVIDERGVVMVSADQDYDWRYKVLKALCEVTEWDNPGGIVNLLRDLRTPSTKQALLADIIENNGGEGVVARRLNSPYQSGKRSSNSLKWKLKRTVDCVVMDRGSDGKDSLTLGVYKAGVLTMIGKVSALTGDGPSAKVGDVVEVSYQNFTGQRLYQPTLPKLRTDKAPLDCTMDQLTTVNLHAMEPTC
jgi:ATP-dependent DNA ligase